MRETILDVVVAQYVVGAAVIVAVLVIGGGLGIFTAMKERRESARRMREIMEGQ